MCRQMLVEFDRSGAGAGEMQIMSVTRNGARAQWRLSELAPSPFTTDSLAHHR
jgi:cytidine deaminase